MYVTQHNTASSSAVRLVCLAGAIAMALSLAGCSAANMTGFEFPVFGLTNKSAEKQEPMSNAEIAENYPADPRLADQRPLPQ